MSTSFTSRQPRVYEATSDASPAPTPLHGPTSSGVVNHAADSPNLDVLRAVAVLFVITFHSLQYFGVPSIRGMELDAVGRLGVYFFFVHTALVLTRSLDRQSAAEAGVVSLAAKFYIRRLLRIYPLAMVVVTVVVAAGLSVRKVDAAYHLAGTRVTWSVFASNVLLIQDLWPRTYIMGVLWSLPLELRMYAALPVLYLLWRRTQSVALLAALWGACAAWVLLQAPLAWFSVVPFTPCFIPGVLAFALTSRWRPAIDGRWWIPLLGALVGVYLALPRTQASNWVVCLLLGLMIPLVCDVRSARLRRTASELAKYSYGIYLVHVPSLAVIAKLRPDTPQPLQVAIYLALVTTFSVAGYHLVERPGIRLGGRLADRWQRWYVRHVARRDALPAAGDAAALNVAR